MTTRKRTPQVAETEPELPDPSSLIGWAVSFANRDFYPGWGTRAKSITDDEWVVIDLHAPKLKPVDVATARAAAEEVIAREHRHAVAMLDAAASGRLALIRFLAELPNDMNESCLFSPQWEVSRDRRQIRLVWLMLRNIEHLGYVGRLNFVAALLASSADDEQTAVGRCHLDSCRRFFVIEKGSTGRPQTRYCCEEHRLQRHALEAAERQRRARASRKAAALHRRKPR